MAERALWTYAYSLRVELPSDNLKLKPPKLAAAPPSAPPEPVAPVANATLAVPTATAAPRLAARPRIKSLATSFMTRYQEP